MISRSDVAVIRAEIQRLQKARDECTDSGVQKQIDAWIEEQKRKLVAEDSSKGTASPPSPGSMSVTAIYHQPRCDQPYRKSFALRKSHVFEAVRCSGRIVVCQGG